MIVHYLSRKLRIGVNILNYTCCVLIIDQTANYLELDSSVYQLSLILTALLHVDLINIAYLMACAFISS